jgi:hypothetical protein
MFGGFRIRNTIYELAWPVLRFIDALRLHPFHALQKRALAETVEYIENHMISAVAMKSQREVLKFGARQALRATGAYCEFGVFKGESLSLISEIAGEGRRVHGFDSFEGLPSAWSGYDKGAGTFNVQGKLPKIRSNTELHKGWFDATIPAFVQQFDGNIAFLHVDCDLYSSTKTIFELLGKNLSSGTIIVFDEYFNYPGWKNHEYKAFQEFIQNRGLKYEYLSYSRYNVCLRIE